MIKIMIVDDEVLVRTGIKSLLDWEQQGYQVVCDAGDGSEAKKKLEKFEPDIILTDLKMEPEDGFELIRYCRERHPEIKLIVLSNYNDFDNVRTAMKLGASDYIFKLMVKPDELLTVLNETAKDIQKPKEDSSENVIHKNIDFIKSGILKQLEQPNQGFSVSAEELFKDIPLNISLEERYRVLRLWIDNIRIIQKKKESLNIDLLMFTMQNMVTELLGRNYPVELIRHGDGEFVAIVNASQTGGLDNGTLDEHCRILSGYIYRYYGLRITIAAGDILCGWESLREGLLEVANIRTECLPRSRDGILFWEQQPDPAEIPENYSAEQLKLLVEQGNVQDIMERWSDFFDWLRENRGIKEAQLRHRLKMFYRLLYYAGHDYRIDMETIRDKNGANLEEAIYGYDRLEDMAESVRGILGQYKSIYLGIQKGKCRKEVNDAKAYAKAHLQEDLSVQTAAELVGMSASRFSHVFKEDTGMTFGEYVIQKRMNLAAKLLRETELKINEVACEVGIDNPNYFSTQFRKTFDLSPLEYRKQR